MNYRQAYDYINSFTNYEQVPGITYALNMDGLTRVDLLMRLLGRPQDSFKSVVIAGTKGKGSTAAMLDSVLRAGAHDTGLYTSPHLHTFRERVRVGGEMIGPGDMGRLVEQRIMPAVQKIQALGEPALVPTTYELATALAFLYFQERGVEIAVLEVGLGGRLDAVNVVTPLVAVITAISLDHTQVLGYSVAEIAEEKAGIIKTGGHVISAPQPQEAMEVIARVADGRRATLDIVGKEVYVSTGHLPEIVSDEEGVPIYQALTLAYEAKGNEARGRMRVQLPLLGSHQQVNAALALAAVRTLVRAGINVSRKALTKGFANVHWPGRLEIVRRQPIVVADGAHNVDSMAKLMQAMYDLFYKRNLIVVIGVSTDKDIGGIVAQFSSGDATLSGPKVEKVIATRTRHPRAADPEEIARIARARDLDVEIAASVAEALARAEALAWEATNRESGEPIVLVTGSLFTVAEAREYYGLAPDLSEEG